MKCTECGSEFAPNNDEEDVCEDCQLEAILGQVGECEEIAGERCCICGKLFRYLPMDGDVDSPVCVLCKSSK